MHYIQLKSKHRVKRLVDKRKLRLATLLIVVISIMLFSACDQKLSGTWVGINHNDNRTETTIFKGNTFEVTSEMHNFNGYDIVSGTFSLETDFIIFNVTEAVAYRDGKVDHKLTSEAQAIFIGTPLTLPFTRSGNIITINNIIYTSQR